MLIKNKSAKSRGFAFLKNFLSGANHNEYHTEDDIEFKKLITETRELILNIKEYNNILAYLTQNLVSPYSLQMLEDERKSTDPGIGAIFRNQEKVWAKIRLKVNELNRTQEFTFSSFEEMNRPVAVPTILNKLNREAIFTILNDRSGISKDLQTSLEKWVAAKNRERMIH